MHTYIPVHHPTCILENTQHNTQLTPLNNMNTEASLNNQQVTRGQCKMWPFDQFGAVKARPCLGDWHGQTWSIDVES